MEWLLAALGLLILLLAGDALVKGAVNLSLRLGIPAIIVSLTVVAFGTSAPELLISVQAVLRDAPGIALGNVVGSNTANILLVLGVPALVRGMRTGACDYHRNYVNMMAVSLIFIGLCLTAPLGRWQAAVLLALLALMLWDQMRRARAHRNGTAIVADTPDEIEGRDPDMPTWKLVTLLTLGLIGLPLGADILVDSSVAIARDFGVSETVIGLTLVAVGTSLPELATTLMAALRDRAEVAIGNVLGSNMFNLLAIIGVAAMIGDIPVDPSFFRLDLWVMLGASLLVAPYVFMRWDMSRGTGIAFTALYGAYAFVLLG